MEQELRRALRRVEPSPGFAERVTGRLAEAKRPAPSRRAAIVRWVGLGLVASIVAASAAGWLQRARRADIEQARYAAAMPARNDVELALRITTEKLQYVQSRVQARVVAVADGF